MPINPRLAGALALATAAALAPSAALANNPFAKDAVKLNVADIDASTPQGERVLNDRIARAAEAVCGQSVSHIHLMMVAKAQKCRSEVIADARARYSANQQALRISGTQ